jgi:hypothetical protein
MLSEIKHHNVASTDSLGIAEKITPFNQSFSKTDSLEELTQEDTAL